MRADHGGRRIGPPGEVPDQRGEPARVDGRFADAPLTGGEHALGEGPSVAGQRKVRLGPADVDAGDGRLAHPPLPLPVERHPERGCPHAISLENDRTYTGAQQGFRHVRGSDDAPPDRCCAAGPCGGRSPYGGLQPDAWSGRTSGASCRGPRLSRPPITSASSSPAAIHPSARNVRCRRPDGWAPHGANPLRRGAREPAQRVNRPTFHKPRLYSKIAYNWAELILKLESLAAQGLAPRCRERQPSGPSRQAWQHAAPPPPAATRPAGPPPRPRRSPAGTRTAPPPRAPPRTPPAARTAPGRRRGRGTAARASPARPRPPPP